MLVHSEWFNGWLLRYWDLTVIARVSPTDCRGVGACLAWIREIEMLRQWDCHNHEPGCDNHGVDFLRPATARESLQLPTGVVVAKPVKVWKKDFFNPMKKSNHLKVKPELADVGAGFADGEDAAPGVGRSVGAWVPGGASVVLLGSLVLRKPTPGSSRRCCWCWCWCCRCCWQSNLVAGDPPTWRMFKFIKKQKQENETLVTLETKVNQFKRAYSNHHKRKEKEHTANPKPSSTSAVCASSVRAALARSLAGSWKIF